MRPPLPVSAHHALPSHVNRVERFAATGVARRQEGKHSPVFSLAGSPVRDRAPGGALCVDVSSFYVRRGTSQEPSRPAIYATVIGLALAFVSAGQAGHMM
jgi:hypothetical protein